MVKAYLSFWKNYVNFHGRTSRSGYWYAVLGNAIVGFLLIFAGLFAGAATQSGELMFTAWFLFIVFAFALIIPEIAISVRRLHDIGKSGLWYLVTFVPVVGPIVLFIFMCLPSIPGPNEYGASSID